MRKVARKLISPVLLSLALALGAAACGGDESDDDASAARTAGNGDVFNEADVEFATAMIPHHAQAIEMVVLAQDRPLDPDVAQLRDQIRESQVPEVEVMTDWLTAWGEEVPETSLDHANAGHHEDGGEMDALDEASDEDFQDLWLTMMIEHHQGALELAQTERQAGEFPKAIALAEAIENGQAKEIATMEELLGP